VDGIFLRNISRFWTDCMEFYPMAEFHLNDELISIISGTQPSEDRLEQSQNMK
jgi:hypothetical protein